MELPHHIVKDQLQGKLNGAQRSGHWRTVRAIQLVQFPTCALCGGKKNLEVHHIRPFHTHPELELEPSNLITLCESKNWGINCHLFFGHLGNFKNINVEVLGDVARFKDRLHVLFKELLEQTPKEVSHSA